MKVYPPDTPLEFLSAREIVTTFDTLTDVSFRHDECLERLAGLGAFSPPDTEEDAALAEFVGAYWCRLVSADVLYHPAEGLEAIEASAEMAERLLRKVLCRPFSRGQTDTNDDYPTFQAYAASRWFDGAGKIKYRLASYSESRLKFQQSVKIAEHAHLWWCLPDLRSNLLRAEIEELKVAGMQERILEFVAKYRALKAQIIEMGKRKGLFDVNGRLRGADLECLPHRHREFLRGVSSISHNLSLALFETPAVPDKSQRSLKESKFSETICKRMKDDYRRAQAILHQARLAESSKSSESWRAAKHLYETVNKARWVRGQRIARQNLSKLRGLSTEKGGDGDPAGAIDDFTTLFDEIDREQTSSGNNPGLDLHFHAYTIDAFETVIGDEFAKRSLSKDFLETCRKRLDDERKKVIRSFRRVVVIGTYKNSFSKLIRPIFMKWVADLLEGEPIQNGPNQTAGGGRIIPDSPGVREAVSLVEESAARELLDLVKAGSDLQRREWGELAPIFFKTVRAAQKRGISAQNRRGRSAACRVGIRGADGTTLEKMVQILSGRRNEYERILLNSPVESTEHEEDIARKILEFTRDNRGTCILRYFVYGEYKKEEPPKLGVFVFLNGTLKTVTGLSIDRVQEVSRSILPGESKVPHVKDCKTLWRALFEPVWSLVAESGLPKHLVVIPTDDLFTVPVHTALYPAKSLPVAAVVPLSLAVSATAYVARGRYRFQRLQLEENDILCALILAEEGVSGEEIAEVNWPAEHFYLAGDCPKCVVKPNSVGDGDWEGLSALLAKKPAFLIYAGHGRYDSSFGDLGPALALRKNYLTQFDVAMRVSLPQNKLTILGACLAGHGVDVGGGEVAGFVRSFIAAGAGALGVTLCEVPDQEVVFTVRHLLRKALAFRNRSFDVVTSLFEFYQDRCEHYGMTAQECIEACPVVLYL